MKTKKRYATERTTALRTIATPSQYISWLDDLEPCPVVIYGRESDRSQAENLPPQLARVKGPLDKREFLIVGIFGEIAPGWMDCRRDFEKAVITAKETRAIIVTEAVNRFWRCYRLKGERKLPPLTVFEMERLMREADGVRLATVIHPDTPEKKVRSEQTKRGQAGKRGERRKPGFMKDRRLERLPIVLELREEGLSYRQIAQKVNISWSVVRDWIKGKSAHLAQNV